MIEKIVKNSLKAALVNDKLCAYIGSGFSKTCGLPDWKELMKPFAESINLDIDKEKEYMQVAQYYVNEKGRYELNNLIKDNFNLDLTRVSNNHKLLASLQLPELWTTNYDNALEKGYESLNIDYDVKKIEEDLSYGINKKLQIYKIHGSCDNPEACVLTQEDYEDYYQNRKYFIEALKTSLIQKQFLFIGFSFNDPDIRFILAELRRANIRGRKHYWVSYDNPDFSEYEKNRQELFIKDLERNYDINAIRISDWNELTNLLSDLNKYKNQQSVFISGALKEVKSEQSVFLENLSSNLIKNSLSIVSGYGLGVGSQIITGALNEIYKENKISSDCLKLHPFPQTVSDPIKRKELWTKYRTDMCKNAGFLIIVFGSKDDGKGNTINSPGIQEEFEIAREKGLFIIPVGSTGFKAKEIWELMNKDYENYGYKNDKLKDYFSKLNTIDITNFELIEVIINIIKEVCDE